MGISKSKTKEFILEFIDKNPNIFDLSNRDNYLGNLNDNLNYYLKE